MTISAKEIRLDCAMSTLVHPGTSLNTIYTCQKSPIFWVKLQAHGSLSCTFISVGRKASRCSG